MFLASSDNDVSLNYVMFLYDTSNCARLSSLQKQNGDMQVITISIAVAIGLLRYRNYIAFVSC